MERNKIYKYGKSEMLKALEKIIRIKSKYGMDGEDIHFYEDSGNLVPEENWED